MKQKKKQIIGQFRLRSSYLQFILVRLSSTRFQSNPYYSRSLHFNHPLKCLWAFTSQIASLTTFPFGISSNLSQQKNATAEIIGLYFPLLGSFVMINLKKPQTRKLTKPYFIFFFFFRCIALFWRFTSCRRKQWLGIQLWSLRSRMSTKFFLPPNFTLRKMLSQR